MIKENRRSWEERRYSNLQPREGASSLGDANLTRREHLNIMPKFNTIENIGTKPSYLLAAAFFVVQSCVINLITLTTVSLIIVKSVRPLEAGINSVS